MAVGAAVGDAGASSEAIGAAVSDIGNCGVCRGLSVWDTVAAADGSGLSSRHRRASAGARCEPRGNDDGHEPDRSRRKGARERAMDGGHSQSSSAKNAMISPRRTPIPSPAVALTHRTSLFSTPSFATSSLRRALLLDGLILSAFVATNRYGRLM